jgi:copper chaperone CopZ
MVAVCLLATDPAAAAAKQVLQQLHEGSETAGISLWAQQNAGKAYLAHMVDASSQRGRHVGLVVWSAWAVSLLVAATQGMGMHVSAVPVPDAAGTLFLLLLCVSSGVESYDISLEKQKVVVKGSLSPQQVLEAVSKTGKKTSLAA